MRFEASPSQIVLRRQANTYLALTVCQTLGRGLAVLRAWLSYPMGTIISAVRSRES